MVNNFRKYLRVTSLLIKNCFSKETAYRLPFFFWVVANLLWLGFSFYSIELLFRQVPIIAGWGIVEARFLVVVHTLFSTLIWIFIMPNLVIFWRLISQGTLDFHLTKPIGARFLASATFFEFDMIPRIIPIGIVFWLLIQSSHLLTSWDQWLIFAVSLILGIATFYNFGYTIATTCFWFTKIDSLEDLFNAVQSISKYPPDIFKGIPKLVFVYAVPSVFLAAFPTMVLLGKGKIDILLWEILAAVVSWLISRWFWNFGLKHYSSASS